jgi:hypothetical protein
MGSSRRKRDVRSSVCLILDTYTQFPSSNTNSPPFCDICPDLPIILGCDTAFCKESIGSVVPRDPLEKKREAHPNALNEIAQTRASIQVARLGFTRWCLFEVLISHSKRMIHRSRSVSVHRSFETCNLCRRISSSFYL